jgi:hypothetical protein
MDRLPLSPEAQAEAEASGEVQGPELFERPWTDFSRGRGLLLLCALAGLLCFFLPWVELRVPEGEMRSGFDLARGRAGWLWGGAAGWFILLPLVWTRRSLAQLWGVRVACTCLALLTAIEVGFLFAFTPKSRGIMPFEFHFQIGLYLSAAVSLAGALVAATLGGTLQRTKPAKGPARDAQGRLLH